MEDPEEFDPRAVFSLTPIFPELSEDLTPLGFERFETRLIFKNQGLPPYGNPMHYLSKLGCVIPNDTPLEIIARSHEGHSWVILALRDPNSGCCYLEDSAYVPR